MLNKKYIIFPHKAMCGSSLPPVVCRRAHVVFTLFVSVCVLCCPTHTVLYFCFVCLHLVYPMLPFLLIVHYYCLSVCSNVYLSCVLCTLCCQFHWIIHFWLLLQYSLTFIFPVSCGPYVAVSLDCSLPFGML